MRTLRSGFGLMEIMFYIAILATLAGVAIPSFMSYRKRAALSKTEQNLSFLKNEINRYYGDTSRYPRALDDLVDKPDPDDPLSKRWSGPYVEIKGGGLPTDGWEQEFQYELTPGGVHPYELYSFGPEGEEGPEEDRISAW